MQVASDGERQGEGKNADYGYMLQIINEEGGWMYVPDDNHKHVPWPLPNILFRDDLANRLNKWNFTSKGFDYRTLSILGGQSSGKSETQKLESRAAEEGTNTNLP